MLELETNFVEHGTMEISMEMYTKDLDCGENTLHLEIDHGKLSAAVQNDDGSFTVKPEYMTQLAKITTPEILDAFLKNAFVKIKQLDNGDFKFEVNQKAKGGMNPLDNVAKIWNNNTVPTGNTISGVSNGQHTLATFQSKTNDQGWQVGAAVGYNKNAHKYGNDNVTQFSIGLRKFF